MGTNYTRENSGSDNCLDCFVCMCIQVLVSIFGLISSSWFLRVLYQSKFDSSGSGRDKDGAGKIVLRNTRSGANWTRRIYLSSIQASNFEVIAGYKEVPSRPENAPKAIRYDVAYTLQKEKIVKILVYTYYQVTTVLHSPGFF